MKPRVSIRLKVFRILVRLYQLELKQDIENEKLNKNEKMKCKQNKWNEMKFKIKKVFRYLKNVVIRYYLV